MKKIVLLASLAILVVSGCRRESLEWNNRLKGPIFQATLDFSDLLIDTAFEENSEGYLDFVYTHSELLDSFSEVLNVEDTLNQVSVNLQQLLLDDRTLEDTFALGDIYPPARIFDGQQAPIPAQDINDAGGGEIDVTEEFFKTATFEKGFLDVTIHNDLPVEVELVDFELKNKNDGVVIIRDQFNNIQPFSSDSKSISLAGKTVEGILVGNLLRLVTKASNGPVLIEADKGIRIELVVRDMEPETATAVFPAQTLVDQGGETRYDFGPAAITVMEVREGFVLMDIVSTIDEEIILEYEIPQSELLNDPTQFVYKQVIVPPAPEGESITIQEKFPIEGYKIFYSGEDKFSEPFFNTVYSNLSARIKYTGIERTLSLKDSVRIIFGLVDVVPSFAIGDFGQKTYTVNEPFQLDAFKKATGNVSLEDAELMMSFTNAFGIQAQININDITAVNNRDNTAVKLTSSFINDDIILNRALNPPLIPSRKQYLFDASNSNVKQFLETLPDQVNADFSIISQPFGSNDYTDFAFFESYMQADLQLRLPMKFNLDNLKIVNAQPFNLGEEENLDRIQEGIFTLMAVNGFPFEAGFELRFMNDQDEILATIFNETERIAAGTIGSDGKVTQPSESQIKTAVSAEDMRKIAEATKVEIVGLLNTTSTERYAIYDDYTMDLKLLADVVYEQKSN